MARRRDAWSPEWPVLKTYDQGHLARIAMPVGGIGTGTVSLGGRGDLRDWEIVNRPAKGFAPGELRVPGGFFVLRTRDARGDVQMKVLEGPIEADRYEGSQGCMHSGHNLPHMRRASFAAAYPLGQVLLEDAEMPLSIRIEAFNPLVPGEADDSGIPIAVLRYVLINDTASPIEATVCGNLVNFIGADGSPTGSSTFEGTNNWLAAVKDNRNEFRHSGGQSGVFLHSKGLPANAPAWGTMALATTARSGVSYRTAWLDSGGPWGDAMLDFWDDLLADGKLDDRPQGSIQAPRASLAVRVKVAPRSSMHVTFLLAWHFPNRMNWFPKPPAEGGGQCCADGQCRHPDWVGNYYARQYRDAWDVVVRTAPRLAKLEAKTVEFVRAFCDSDLPAVVKEAALFNVSTLRTQTAFRIDEGYLLGWEGCGDRHGCCHGSCTHVWNYEMTTPLLFADLARGMRQLEFAHATDERGMMSFRVGLPLGRAKESTVAAADGQMGGLMKLFREWQLSGDDDLLRHLWPAAKRALEFCWIPGGWDADQDGVMEGCQHNTMDVEYYGPNPQMGSWYLGALRAMEEMARHLEEAAFADKCRRLFESGRAWMDSHLFNGQYYEHEIRPVQDAASIAKGLIVGMGAKDPAHPILQLGAGCLVDQLVGQYFAHLVGLGYLLDAGNVRTTLASILKHNWRDNFFGHFNNGRSYVMNDESALLMASYPLGRRPERPFPYYAEVMTGFEYAAAVGMLQEGMTREGLQCIAAVRSRYDGARRSPFNEAECGHHYARAMAAWSAVLTLTGFSYSGVTKTIRFAATKQPATFFWSNGSAWGTFRQATAGGKVRCELKVLHGQLTIRALELAGAGRLELPREKTIASGKTLPVTIDRTAASDRGEGILPLRPAGVSPAIRAGGPRSVAADGSKARPQMHEAEDALGTQGRDALATKNMNPQTIHDILGGDRTDLAAVLLRGGLAAASVPYAAAMRLRRWAYRKQLPLFISHRPRAARAVPTICVGNLTTGGTGKTPMVAWVVAYLKGLGRQVAILTRGYKARSGQSDEAMVLAEYCGPDVRIVVNADRVAGAQAAINAGADVLVMDDGFQHRRLARDLDLVLVDAANPFGYGWCLPRGLMREPPSALRDAHVIVITRSDHATERQRTDLTAHLATLAPQATIVQAAHVADCVLDEAQIHQPVGMLAGKKVFAFCGLGNPSAFFAMVRGLGAEVVGERTFPDHFGYGPADVEAIIDSAQLVSAEALLTTRKDFVKIADNPSDLPLWQLLVHIEVTQGRQELCDRIERSLG